MRLMKLFTVTLLGIAVCTSQPVWAGGRNSYIGTVTLSPNPAPSGTTLIVISGSGFKPGEGLNVGLPGIVPSYNVVTDASGAFTLNYTMAGAAPFTGGDYTFQIQRWSRKRWATIVTANLHVY